MTREKKFTPGPWHAAQVTDADGVTSTQVRDADGDPLAYVVKHKVTTCTVETINHRANAATMAAATELLEIAEACENSIRRAPTINAPEDAEIEALCERIGYGAVMDAACRLWHRKDPVGSITMGPCAVTVRAAIAKAYGEQK